MLPDALHNNYLLRLLFDYRGRIRQKEYFVGQLVILLFLMCCVLYITHEAFFWVPGTLFNSSPRHVRVFIDGLLPQCTFLIPILFYSTFVLTLKRIRSLKSIIFFKYLLWGSSFLFYCAFARLIFAYWHVANTGENISTRETVICLVFLLLGLISILILLFKREEIEEREVFAYGDKRQVKYLFRLVILYGITSSTSWFCYTNVVSRPILLEAITSVPLVLATSCFLYLLLKRLTNVNFSLSIFFCLFAFAFIYQTYIVYINPSLFFVADLNTSCLMNIFDCSTYIFAFIFMTLTLLFTPSLDGAEEA